MKQFMRQGLLLPIIAIACLALYSCKTTKEANTINETLTECKPVRGNYMFGKNINIKVIKDNKTMASMTVDDSTKTLDVKVAFFPPTEKGYRLSMDYLSRRAMTDLYQQNGMCVNKKDTTIKYWVALSGNDGWYH